MAENCEREVQNVNNARNDCGLNLTALVKELKPAVARIDVFANDSYAGNGSGYVICDKDKTDCVIMTNQHVVSEGDKYKVKMTGLKGTPTIEAKLQIVDEKNDLAILSLDPKFLPNRSKKLNFEEKETELGDSIFAMGHPRGSKSLKISPGRVLNPNDQSYTLDSTGQRVPDRTTIESSLRTSTGNSGGPQFNKSGKIVGTTVEGAPDSTYGIVTFAVPAEASRALLEKYFQSKKKPGT